MDYAKRALLGIVMATCVSSFGADAAFAQTGAVGQPAQREERPGQREQEKVLYADPYDPLGVRIGSFRLFPTLELNEVYNDNIYAASNATGKTGSFVQLIKPSVDLRS